MLVNKAYLEIHYYLVSQNIFFFFLESSFENI